MSTPLSWLLGRESPVPGLPVTAEHARRNAEGLCPTPSSFLTATPWTHPRSCNAALWGAVTRGGPGPKEGAAGGRPSTRRHGTQGPFRSSPGRASTSFGRSRCSFSAGGPAWVWRLWAGAEGSRPPGPRGRPDRLAPAPRRPQPRQSAGGTQAAQASDAWRQPGRRGLKEQDSSLHLAFRVGVDATPSAVERVCFFVSRVQQHDSRVHSRVHGLFWVLFASSLLCSVGHGSLSCSGFLLIIS